jgi:hypothetical protein
MFWEFYQQGQIHQAKSNASRAEQKAISVKGEIQRVSARIDSLALTCQAMWELIRERTNLSDEDIEARMQEIDLRDGREDGRMHTPVFECSECGRKVSSRHQRCLYCGAEFDPNHLFES